jgi:fimbrial isopeptide formation D2 family protein
VSDGSSTSVVIVAPVAEKEIYDVQRNGVDIGPTNQIRPGDIVTFLLQVSVPTTNLGEFYVTDYLPIPLFQADEFTTGQAPLSQGNTSPPAGQWQLTSNDTLSSLSGVVPSLVVDASQNTLEFFYGNVYNSSQPSSLVNILFTVTATGDPMSNGLYLTNWMNVNYNNTVMQMFTNNQIVSIVTNEPQLTITKTASPNTGQQAGGKVTYTITIKNTGNAPAYNVNITDNLLSSLGIYINGTPTVTARYQDGSSINLTGLGDLFGTGLNFGSSFPIFASNETNNTIILTYNAILSSDVYPLQVMNNTAQITNFTSLPSS